MAALIVCIYSIARDGQKSCSDRTERVKCAKKSARISAFLVITYGVFAGGVYLLASNLKSDNFADSTWGWVLTSIGGLFVLPLEIVIWSVIGAYICRCNRWKHATFVRRVTNIVTGPDAIPDANGHPTNGSSGDTSANATNGQVNGSFDNAIEPPAYDSVVTGLEESYLPPKYDDAVKGDAAKQDEMQEVVTVTETVNPS